MVRLSRKSRQREDSRQSITTLAGSALPLRVCSQCGSTKPPPQCYYISTEGPTEDGNRLRGAQRFRSRTLFSTRYVATTLFGRSTPRSCARGGDAGQYRDFLRASGSEGTSVANAHLRIANTGANRYPRSVRPCDNVARNVADAP